MARTFDERELLDRVGNDLEFLAETVQMLELDGRSLMAEVHTAAESGDAGALGRAAHALKGMVSNFCSADVQQAAQAVEALGRSGNTSSATRLVRELGELLEALIEELNSFIKARS